ncbi:T9SS type A sorting domain-containing protein [Chryseobacterium sp.]|uniref:T9SS type A sorting domain-containing protein n=1 Tax=Chryseobacterium sp. TaxID=1871047 RepID=UPI000EB871FE|nr:T9SS type A sorting domain-containing protein [Chryseobacterium sp.]HCA07729.1 hypothetical protein [Chryseobacterium sp.]
MKKFYFGALTLCTFLGLSAHGVLWQKGIKSFKQNFQNKFTTNIDQQSLIIEKQNFKIYQNPFSDYAYLGKGFDFKEADIILYDMGGRQLQSLKTKNKVTKINTQNLIQGAYLVTIKTDGNKTANTKLIKK